MKTILFGIVAYCAKKEPMVKISADKDTYTRTVISAEREHALNDPLTSAF